MSILIKAYCARIGITLEGIQMNSHVINDRSNLFASVLLTIIPFHVSSIQVIDDILSSEEIDKIQNLSTFMGIDAKQSLSDYKATIMLYVKKSRIFS